MSLADPIRKEKKRKEQKKEKKRKEKKKGKKNKSYYRYCLRRRLMLHRFHSVTPGKSDFFDNILITCEVGGDHRSQRQGTGSTGSCCRALWPGTPLASSALRPTSESREVSSPVRSALETPPPPSHPPLRYLHAFSVFAAAAAGDAPAAAVATDTPAVDLDVGPDRGDIFGRYPMVASPDS